MRTSIAYSVARWPDPSSSQEMMCRLVSVSVASNAAKTQVFFGELGASTLHSWKFMLNDDPPLSPPKLYPDFICWDEPIVPCETANTGRVMNHSQYCYFIYCWLPYLAFWSRSSMTFAAKWGIHAWGDGWTSSPQFFMKRKEQPQPLLSGNKLDRTPSLFLLTCNYHPPFL